MDGDDLLRGTHTYLEWLGGEAEAVLEELGVTMVREVIQTLATFADQAESVATEQDLLRLASEVQTWIEATPALRAILVEPGTDVTARQRTRAVTLAQQQRAAAEDIRVNQAKHALANHFAETREALIQALAESAPKELPGNERSRNE